ncbi:MAG TPA: hypothetical protein VND80_08455 [Steroidobacteraceae bacterium]|nr:hypothetical protein [Steroidobacteraceae bacterium]
MKLRQLAICTGLVMMACAACAARASIGSANEPLRLLGRTEIPGYTGDFDHVAADIADNRLFMAAEDHGTLEVFNLRSGAHLRTLTTFNTPHGIFLVPGTHRMIVTDSGKGFSRILSTRTYRVLGRIKLAPGADSSVYDPSTGRFYIVTGGGDVGMKVSYLNEIDPRSGRLLRRLRFDSNHTEAIQAEQHGDRLFVNIADKNYVAVVDKKSFKVVARWPIVGARTNLSMALDEPDHRLFVVTRNPTRMFVLDTNDGKTVASVGVPAIVDGVFWDAARKRIYVPGAVGEVGVYQEIDPDHYRELARVPSAIGAKSGLYVPQLNRLYLAASPGKRVGGALLWFAAQPR